MKLHPDRADGLTITGFGADWIALNGERHATHLLIDSRGEFCNWKPDLVAPWDEATLAWAAARKPEVVLLGSGALQRFPPPVALRGLMTGRVGFEAMDTAAACRTYNILAGEGRHVVALLVLAGAAQA